MKTTSLMRAAVLLMLVEVGACADSIPSAPSTSALTRVATGPMSLNATETIGDEDVMMSPIIGEMNARLAAAGANVRISKAELILDMKGWAGQKKATIILANDRDKNVGAEWVRGDLRRAGRRGVDWAFGSNRGVAPFVWNSDRTGFRPATLQEVVGQVDESMEAWKDLRCSNDPISRVPVPAGTDPDLLDEIFRGLPVSANYLQPGDIVQAGWQPIQFFQAFAGADADLILGVTFTFTFVDAAGVDTDVDGDGELDIGLSEVYYNGGLGPWGNDGAADVIDFYSIITHESGHALGLGHWGKIWVYEKDAADGITLDEVHVKPVAMMNAIYLGGRNEIRITDRKNFCRLWETRRQKGKNWDRD